MSEGRNGLKHVNISDEVWEHASILAVKQRIHLRQLLENVLRRAFGMPEVNTEGGPRACGATRPK